MLTLKEFQQIPAGKIFASGLLPNSEEGLFMTRDGGELKWIAKKGYGDDWAIYCHWGYNDTYWISHHGDKVVTNSNILKCVPCTEEVLNKYRK